MTNEWRTLEEIYKKVGKFPFQAEIRRGIWSPYILHAFSKNGDFISEDRDAVIGKWPPETLAKLHTLPKPKKKIKFHDIVVSNRDSGLETYREWFTEERLNMYQEKFPENKITILKTEEVEVDE